MPAPLSSTQVPTREEIETELSLIWPGWIAQPDGEPRNLKLKPAELPEPWLRRVKWLLKLHSLHRRGLVSMGWRATLIPNPRRPGQWFSHPVEPDREGNPREVTPPAKVPGPPPGHAEEPSLERAASISPAALAVATGRPLGLVRRALEALPTGEDPRAWVQQFEGGAL